MNCFNGYPRSSVVNLVQRTRLALVLCLVAGGVFLNGAEKPGDPAFDRLAKVGVFAFGGVGFAGITSQGEKDYRIIFARSSARVDFERLLTAGNIQAKGYALVAIHQLEPEKFAGLSLPFENSEAKVTTMSGCIMSRQTFSSLIARIKAGHFLAP